MIIAISDLHGNLPSIPPCDVLLIGGDICPDFGFPPTNASLGSQLHWLGTKFREWLSIVPAKKIIAIAGNHDFVFEDWASAVERLNLPWTYLKDQSHEYDGVKYYGIPWVPNLRSWAFYKSDADLEDAYRKIPDDTDIIISHGPPNGYLDECPRHVGSAAGDKAIARVQPKVFICGHIHEAFGKVKHPSGTDIYNVSYVDEFYTPRYTFPIIDYPTS